MRCTKLFLCFLLLYQPWQLILHEEGPAEQKLLAQEDLPKIKQSQRISEIKLRGKMIVAMTKNDQYPFFYTLADGRFVGLDVEIAKQIASSLKVQLEIDRSAESFNDLIPLVEAGVVDMAISKLSRTLIRSQKVLFSDPYIIFRQALLVNRVQLARVSSSDAETKEVVRQFSGKLGVIANSSYERYAKRNFPLAKIVRFPTWPATLEALVNTEVFAVYRDEMEIHKYIEQNPQQNLYLKSIVIKDREDPIAIALPPGTFHFMVFVNLSLETFSFLPKNTKALLKNFGTEAYN